MYSNSKFVIDNKVLTKCEVANGTVTIPGGVESIGNSAFEGCDSVTEVIVPKGVKSIGDSAFQDCTALAKIVLPEGLTHIGKGAFSDCTALTSIVIPESVTSIAEEAFSGCTSLTGIVIPDTVKCIDRRAFYNCTSLAVVNIPDSVKTIGEQAFYNCKRLANLVVPESVDSIGILSFYGCPNITLSKQYVFDKVSYQVDLVTHDISSPTPTGEAFDNLDHYCTAEDYIMALVDEDTPLEVEYGVDYYLSIIMYNEDKDEATVVDARWVSDVYEEHGYTYEAKSF